MDGQEYGEATIASRNFAKSNA